MTPLIAIPIADSLTSSQAMDEFTWSDRLGRYVPVRADPALQFVRRLDVERRMGFGLPAEPPSRPVGGVASHMTRAVEVFPGMDPRGHPSFPPTLSPGQANAREGQPRPPTGRLNEPEPLDK